MIRKARFHPGMHLLPLCELYYLAHLLITLGSLLGENPVFHYASLTLSPTLP
jgi:hypothetical protein